MLNDFKNDLFFNNLSYFLNSKGMKPSELEKEAGLTGGYLLRAKENDSKPNIDIVYKISQVLDVPIDHLIALDYLCATPMEIYLSQFVTRLQKDSELDSLVWTKKMPIDYKSVEIKGDRCMHPMFTPMEKFDDMLGEHVYVPVFLSEYYGEDTVINEPCFETLLNGKTRLYLMACAEVTGGGVKSGERDVELWSNEGVEKPEFICGTANNPTIAVSLQTLYDSLVSLSYRPHISKNLKESIEEYMNPKPKY